MLILMPAVAPLVVLIMVRFKCLPTGEAYFSVVV
jgi:hypothetical protein